MYYKKAKILYPLCFIFVILFIFLFSPYSHRALAAPPDCNPDTEVCLQNPLETEDANTLIGKIINAVLGIVGSLALIMFVYGGFTWMLAAGNNEKVQKGKDILIWATVGLVVIFSAYALVKFVFTGLGVG